MPIQLAPLDRREFLGRAAGAMVALSAIPILGRAYEAGDEETIALLSDTHIAEDRDRVNSGAKMALNFERVRREILEMQTRPSRVLVNGDCAFLMGQAGDYKTLVELCAPLREAGVAIDVTLGNHDDRDEFKRSQVVEAANSPVMNKHAAVRETKHVNWFLLDSLEAVNQTPGSLGEAQLDWLDRALRERSTKPAFVMFHHNVDYYKQLKGKSRVVAEVANKRLPVPGITDDERLLEILKNHANVSAYFCGHTHQWNVLNWEGILVVNLPTTAYTFTPDDPNGWVVCRHGGDSTELELRALDPKHKYHAAKIAVPYRRG